MHCLLCKRPDQTDITGALSTKDDVTAHQNCLLFASGIFCCNTPQYDNLFGFSVEDVQNEVKRGRKLTCNKCKKKGATAGCEVRRCKKSYHYPCAVEERAEIVEDVTKEEYVLYCYKHYPKTQGHNDLTTLEILMQRGFDRNRAGMAVAITGNQGIELAMKWLKVHENDPGTDEPVGNVVGGAAVTQSPTDEPSIADPAEENNPSENGRLPLSSQSRAYRNPEEAGTSKFPKMIILQRPTVYSSDSNSSSSRKPSSIKRQLSFRDKQNGTPSKRRSKVSWASLKDDSSNSGDNELDSVMAPLDTDIDDSEHLVHEPLTRETHFCLEEESRDGATDEDETINSDAESESLLSPFSQTDFSTQTSPTSPMLTPSEVRCKTERLTQTDDGGSLHMNQELELCAVSPEGSPVHSPSDPHTTGPSPSALTDAGSSACVTLPTSCSPPVAPPPHVAPPPDPSPSEASSRFWRSCNAAGCTQNIFIGFFKEMSDVSDRIQEEQASQEDYDLALTVMRASGKLLELVGNQQEELQGKQRELKEAAAAMEEAVSALKRDEEQLSQSHTHHS